MDQNIRLALGLMCNWDCMPHTSRMRQTPRYGIYFVGGPAGSLPGRSMRPLKMQPKGMNAMTGGETAYMTLVLVMLFLFVAVVGTLSQTQNKREK